MKQSFRRAIPCKRRLITTAPEAAWKSLLDYWANTTPFPGFIPEPFPGDPSPGGPGAYVSQYRAILTEGRKYLGNSYSWGGKTPPYFDCSGFVGWCYKYAGVIPNDVTSSTYGLRTYCVHIDSAYRRPGDLCFWSGNPDESSAHVAIYIGNERIFDCSGGGVAYRDLNWHPVSRFMGYWRPPTWIE